MSDLTELYQSVILDHNRRPRNYGAMPQPDASAEGKNPLCGDQLTLWVRLDGQQIADIRFIGSGCAISRASASMMTAAVKGKSRGEADALFERFHRLVTGRAAPGDDPAALGSLAAFSGVSRFPVRVKCASLAWHTLRAALAQRGEIGTV
ncbi:MAG: SUF system NifU family Fe-S cluster assembly protein [Gemmatimonadota bacterium]|nr:SUF system NifU family Fe-S cluster assembly protein [Gemmatimonadota bacterium]